MVKLKELVDYTNNLLKLHDTPDYGPMGLQFTGSDEVRSLGTAVSLSREVIERGKDKDIIVAHHGLFWNNEPRLLDPRRRLELLRDYDISILGYHLCLDRHPKYGNNILAARLLGLGSLTPWQDVGYSGVFKEPMEQNEFIHKAVTKFTKIRGPVKEPIDFYRYGPDKISSVAVITGGAPQYIIQAHQDGFDTFVTGETAEPTAYLAQDLGMNFMALGHFRTETLGVIKLGRHLSKKFGITHEFIQ